MSKPQKPLIDRLHDKAKVLRAAAAISDGRLGYVREYRKLADLLTEAEMFIAGTDAGRKMRGQR
jgi:hypothetical protein